MSNAVKEGLSVKLAITSNLHHCNVTDVTHNVMAIAAAETTNILTPHCFPNTVLPLWAATASPDTYEKILVYFSLSPVRVAWELE
jgi:hypothetical protein